MRVPAMQAWPLFMKPAWTASFTAVARSASSRITTGDLPPSSSVTRLQVSAAARRICLPTAVDPVNEILAMSGWALSSAPTVSPRPVTMLKTPAGSPASCSASVTTCVWMALISLGLTIAVQPAASAAASLPQMKPASLFHGVMRPATPSGSITTSALPARRVNS